MESLTAIAATLAVLAVASGKLPWMPLQFRKAQIHLIIYAQASRRLQTMTFPNDSSGGGKLL